MQCYFHPQRQAVGMCKFCQRGLCMDCAAVIDDVLACRNRHEEQVHRLEQLTARNLFQSSRLASGYIRNAIFYGLTGAVFTAFGLWQLNWLGLQSAVFILLGGFLLYAALANYLEGRKFR
jgi:hypothetical protein